MPQQSNFWNKQATRYDAAISDHDAQYATRLNQLKQLIKPTDDVLDFGCASGEIALDLAPYVKSIEGIDPASAMIELAYDKAAKRDIRNASFLTADIFDPRLEPESFDAILAFNVMHLVKDHHEVIHRAKTLLKPGGMLFVETPCLVSSPGGNANSFWRPAHCASRPLSMCTSLANLKRAKST